MNADYRRELEGLGTDVDGAISRMMNDESFFNDMWKRFFADEKDYLTLKRALKEGKVSEAFEAAHAIKGVAGNLGMNGLYDRIVPLSDLLKQGSLPKDDTMFNDFEANYLALKAVVAKYLG